SVVNDETGTAVADVFAFRFSLSQSTLSRAPLQSFIDPLIVDVIRLGADVVVFALPPGPGVQTIFADLVDAAGNVTSGFQVAVRVDNIPPGLIFVVNAGQATSNPSVGFTVTAPAGAEVPSTVSISVDGGAGGGLGGTGPFNFTLPLDGTERVTLPANDGVHHVLATAFDEVGNQTQS